MALTTYTCTADEAEILLLIDQKYEEAGHTTLNLSEDECWDIALEAGLEDELEALIARGVV